MKKVFLLAAAIVISTLSLSAKGHFGIVAGANNAELPINNMTGSGMWGFTGGAAYHHPFALGFAIQPELVFDTKGTNWTDNEGNDNFRVGYLELPVQLQWGPDLVLFRPYIFAEPFIGFALAGKYNDQSFPLASDKMVMANMKGRFEYGIGVGIGFEVARHLQLSAKYYWNFEDFNYMVDGQWLFKGDYSKACQSFRGVSIKLGYFF